MARHNLVFLLGYVNSIQIHNTKGGEPYAMVYMSVARSDRKVGDHRQYMKCDMPLVMTRDPDTLREMSSWQQFDIVEVKGMIAAKGVGKSSFCGHCGERNLADGTMVYVNPIFAAKRGHKDTQDECIQFLTRNREISNQVFTLGELCRDPKKITPKAGLTVTQYQIALNRKYRIAADPPEIRSDYPWVKSYGENALNDRKYLHIGSQVFIDGCLQARKVQRHSVCEHCGQKYEWADRALEIVPYETEYLANFYTHEEAEAKMNAIAADKVRGLLSSLTGFDGNDVPDDEYSEDDVKAGIQSEELP